MKILLLASMIAGSLVFGSKTLACENYSGVYSDNSGQIAIQQQGCNEIIEKYDGHVVVNIKLPSTTTSKDEAFTMVKTEGWNNNLYEMKTNAWLTQTGQPVLVAREVWSLDSSRNLVKQDWYTLFDESGHATQQQVSTVYFRQ